VVGATVFSGEDFSENMDTQVSEFPLVPFGSSFYNHCRVKFIYGCYQIERNKNSLLHGRIKPIPVAARSKAWVCGRSLAAIAGSNPAGGMDVCLL
jgi:hypothetical protein